MGSYAQCFPLIVTCYKDTDIRQRRKQTAMSLLCNRAVLRRETTPFEFKLSRDDHQVVGALNYLTPAEVAHLAKGRLGFRGRLE